MTNQPPTTFAVASTIATNPTIFMNVSSASPSTMIAPTMTMPWMKFVPDISGVCSIVGTFEITSKPRKIASARIVSSITSESAHASSFGRVTHAPPVISSSKSSASSPPGARCWSSAATLRA